MLQKSGHAKLACMSIILTGKNRQVTLDKWPIMRSMFNHARNCTPAIGDAFRCAQKLMICTLDSLINVESTFIVFEYFAFPPCTFSCNKLKYTLPIFNLLKDDLTRPNSDHSSPLYTELFGALASSILNLTLFSSLCQMFWGKRYDLKKREKKNVDT